MVASPNAANEEEPITYTDAETTTSSYATTRSHDAKVDRDEKAEAAKFFAGDHQKSTKKPPT
jgi:hypothetical protein